MLYCGLPTQRGDIEKSMPCGAISTPGKELRWFQDLSSITLQSSRELKPLLEVLRSKGIVYRWKFSFGLAASTQGRSALLRIPEDPPISAKHSTSRSRRYQTGTQNSAPLRPPSSTPELNRWRSRKSATADTVPHQRGGHTIMVHSPLQSIAHHILCTLVEPDGIGRCMNSIQQAQVMYYIYIIYLPDPTPLLTLFSLEA